MSAIITETASTPESRLSTGVAGLDDILAGGLPSNHLYLIEGNPGTGKTTIALHYLLEGARQGERGLYVTLSESKGELLGVAASHGWSLDGITIFEMTAQGEEAQPEAQYTVFHPAEVELADTIASVLKVVEEVQATRVVFDSLSELRMLARDPLRYRRQILALKRFFTGRNCTVLLLDDRTADKNDLQLQSIAHGVILMQNEDRDYGITRRRLEVLKLRGSKYREGYHDYTIETGGVRVFPRLVAAEHHEGKPHEVVPSGIQGLDTLLGGGLATGTSNLLMGPAGCGKTSVAVRYAHSWALSGQKAAVFLFDETIATLLHRSAGLGMDLRPELKAGRIQIHQVDPAEMGAGEFVYRVRKAIDSGVKLVVIDSLNGFFYAMSGEHSVMLQVHELMQALQCPSCEAICREVENAGAGALIIAEEALSIVDIQRLADLMSKQPAWSDFPLILLTLSGEVTVQTQRRRLMRAPLGRALELERPVRPETLISTVQSALRARSRQYEIRDYILQERNAEEALRRSEKLAVAGRLAATIAHEINNPLEAVINLVYLARTSRSQAAAREYLERAESELGRVSAIASETLKFYRQSNRATETRIPEILRSLLVLYRDKIASSKVELRTDFAEVPPIVAFAGELRQVFSNLLTNAIDAAAGARIEIRLRPARDRSGRKGVKVLVADTGTGIPESVKSSIFEPFVSTKETRGTGLGLWVSWEIVRKHGGSIRMRSWSRPDLHGTVFCVFLPEVADSAESRAAAD